MCLVQPWSQLGLEGFRDSNSSHVVPRAYRETSFSFIILYQAV